METTALDEVEKVFLRARLPVPAILLSFGLIGVIACLYLLIQKWPTNAFGLLALLILDLAATYLLWKVVSRHILDFRTGQKRVLRTNVEKKHISNTKRPRYFLQVGGKDYQVSVQTFARYEVGSAITVFFTYATHIWLGFDQTQLPAAPTENKTQL
ncbi:MAG TPA: hypothetical protein ENJ82_15200 [Bacteroidetes bacterium]|nr:hypothetical protein [Bacteroidota bacterium]